MDKSILYLILQVLNLCASFYYLINNNFDAATFFLLWAFIFEYRYNNEE